MLKAKLECRRASALVQKPNHNSDTVRVFVGKEGREFIFSKRALSSASPYFASRLDASGLSLIQRNAQLNTLWLEDLCPEMFELFAYWMIDCQNINANTTSFQLVIEVAHEDNCCEELHWDLINLHLFAARIGIDALQDAAMDAIQDIYLSCDWDITPKLVSHIYTECDPTDSYRLRKWIVTMAAWSLNGLPDSTPDGADQKIKDLFELVPEFREAYVTHLKKSSMNKVKLQFKNPQLRLPSNNLRNDERQFGFRQCSFHTHRSTVGQGRCPHKLDHHSLTSPPELSFLDSEDEDEVPDHSVPDHYIGSVTGKELIASPTTAIFELYLDIH